MPIFSTVLAVGIQRQHTGLMRTQIQEGPDKGDKLCDFCGNGRTACTHVQSRNKEQV